MSNLDLIEQLLKAKENTDQIDLHRALNEIIVYQKLSKIPAFADPEKLKQNSRLPLLAKALNGQPFEFWLMNTAIEIASNVDRSVVNLNQIFANEFTKRQSKQLAILGNVRQYAINYYSLQSFDLDNQPDKLLILSNAVPNGKQVALIVQGDKFVNIYTGFLGVSDLENKFISNHMIPYVKDGVEIKIISNQGNNDFNFAKIGDWDVSMPNNHSFCYVNRKTGHTFLYDLSDEQVQSLFFNHSLDLYCKYIADGLATSKFGKEQQ